MLKVEAVIRNSKLIEVQEALNEIGISTFSSYKIKLSGIHKGHSSSSGKPGTVKSSDFIPKTKIEIFCSENEVDTIFERVQKSAKTGEKGDGIILVHNIDKIMKIRTGKTGQEAI